MVSDIIYYSIVVSSSIILISLSLHTIIIRRKHVKDMRKRRRHFGIVSEKFNILSKLKKSMKGVLKLNIVTVILVINSNITKLYGSYFNTAVNWYYTCAWNFTDTHNFKLQHRRVSFALCIIALLCGTYQPRPCALELLPKEFTGGISNCYY